ncbi:hypothetical protein [Thiobacillus denitrificans]|uniref:Uncharacterized protein n=1 Tax=Thiobacillus denitrificans TaxID=36861 RepID=A0A106BW18_THIDE|nr:hypothetical protein [Thiobacillus denitrificans]KVW99515.1 hypothetical protein ABW22_01470 [Thiobacillus denitrificans]
MILVSQGPIYMGDYNATLGQAASGYLVNMTKIGCANSKLSVTLSRSTKDIKESCSGNKLTIAQIETEKSAEAALDMVEFDKKMLAYALGGTLSAITGSSVTAEVFPTVAVGDTVSLKYTDVSSLVITDSTGTPVTLTLGTNYTLDSAEHGLVSFVSLGALIQPFKAAYTYAAQGNIVGFNKAAVEKGIVYQGTNSQDGKKYKVIIPRISFGMDGEFNWLSTEETTISLKGQMLYVDKYANDTVYGPFMRVSGGLVT